MLPNFFINKHIKLILSNSFILIPKFCKNRAIKETKMFLPIVGRRKRNGLLWLKSNKMAAPSRNIPSTSIKPALISSSRTKRIHPWEMHQKLSQKECSKFFFADKKIKKVNR